MDVSNLLHKRGRKKGGGLTRQQAKFKKAAQHCHGLLRGGALSAKGDFKKCMRSGLK